LTAARVEGRTGFDAVLLGAGPAGCAAAHHLAGMGARVLLIDFREARARKGEVLHSFVRPVLASLGLAGHGRCGLSPAIAGSVLNWGGPTREYSTISCPNGSSYLVDRL
jgi:flavin-dependent dehydrogenase